jgi:hypothetical protein
LTRSRRTAAGLKQVEQISPRPLPDTPGLAVFDGPRLGPEWPPFPEGTDQPMAQTVKLRHRVVPPEQSFSTVPPIASPALVLVAAASILEGYRWLKVIPAGGWQPSELVFVVLAVPVAMILTRSRRDGRRAASAAAAAKMVTVTAMALLVVTVLALFVDRPSLALLTGIADLLFAVAALAAVLVNERAVRRRA